MNDRFEKELQSALRPIDPGSDFTKSVLEKVRGVERVTVSHGAWRWSTSSIRWLSAGAAASLVAAVMVITTVREQREREAGLRAKEQVLEALHMTSEKLKLAYRVVHDQSNTEQREPTDKREPGPSKPTDDHSGV